VSLKITFKNAAMRLISVVLFLTINCYSTTYSQNKIYTKLDTLRGTVTKERKWWDLKFYHLNVSVNPEDSSIIGKNSVQYKVLDDYNVMQVDLQAPLKIDKVLQDNNQLEFSNEGNACFIKLIKKQKVGEINEIVIFYKGKPKIAVNPPWSGGVSWKKDSEKNHYISTTCQGDGASLWWPCKDHQYDKPDSMLISITVPENLVDVSNGRLRSIVTNSNKTKTYNWFVSNPINNYCVNVNIGNYVHFKDKYRGEKGIIDCDYYVIPENLEKAKKYFKKEVKRMFDALEFWFGPYPFYEDSYKLVDVSYTGMEHQSSVTYGNLYEYGYRKKDVSKSGWGLKFDFIIVHESSHEWFGNSITSQDLADMWIHESFGAYSETLFTDYHFGKKASSEYIIGTRANIKNDRPIIGDYNVNQEGSKDMYSKGANMLHTIRQIMNDDEKFRHILRGLSKNFCHQTVTTRQIENFISTEAKIDLSCVFDQYLRTINIPVIEYSVSEDILRFRWTNSIPTFNMPLKVKVNGKDIWIYPTTEWKVLKVESDPEIIVDPNFYVTAKNL